MDWDFDCDDELEQTHGHNTGKRPSGKPSQREKPSSSKEEQRRRKKRPLAEAMEKPAQKKHQRDSMVESMTRAGVHKHPTPKTPVQHAHQADGGTDCEVTLGTDFSGLETPSRALKAVGVHARLVFTCEKEAALRNLIATDCCSGPELIMYTDVETRDIATVPRVQCYVAGPSCQPYSTGGRRAGPHDPRGKHVDVSLAYILKARPTTFVIENVPNLAKEFDYVFAGMLSSLRGAGYKVKHKCMNTMRHGGLPQDRDRLYIVGILRENISDDKPFKFPERLEHEPLNIAKLFERRNKKVITSPCSAHGNQKNINTAIAECEHQGINPHREPVIIDIDSSVDFSSWRLGYTPTITAARGATGFFCTTLGRRLCVSEMLRLQGFRPETVSWEAAGVPRTKMGKAIGNAMTCSILERLLPRILWSAGLIPKLPKDMWVEASYNPF